MITTAINKDNYGAMMNYFQSRIDYLIANPEEEQKIKQLEEKQKLQICNRNYYRCGAMKRDLEKAGFNNFISYKNNPDQNKLRDLCLNYLQQFQRDTDFNKILILYGKAGTGKTYFALSILKMLSIIQKQPLTIKSNEKEIVLDNIYMFYSGKYVTSEDLCNDFYNSDFNTKTTRQYQIELFKTTEMLVIDEIGRGFTNPNKERNALFSIINYRINNYLPTILCTNLQERELAELFGDALLTRILQVGIKFCTDGIDNMRLVLKNRNYGA